MDLKNRKRFTSTIPLELAEAFGELAELTRIPKSRLLDEAIIDLIAKYKDKSKIEPADRQQRYQDLYEKIKNL